MPKIPCVYVIVCMSARKKAPVNLLSCLVPLRTVHVHWCVHAASSLSSNVLIPYCWSVALERKEKKKKEKESTIAKEDQRNFKAVANSSPNNDHCLCIRYPHESH